MFSGALTSSPIKRKLRSDYCHSPDVSLLSPDSSYLLDCSDGAPCSYRRSPRLLTNGYYDVTQGSFTWDQDGNVSLTPGKTSVCYKENLVRIFRRRRRPHSSLVSLLHNVKDNCQSWLDHGLFRGVFRTSQCQDLNPPSPVCSPHRPRWDQEKSLDQSLDQSLDLDWSRADTDEPTWTRLNSTELEERSSFVYDATEAPPPPDKQPMIQEEPRPDTCQSQDAFSQSVVGLSEVPPTPVFNSQGCCCPSAQQSAGLTLRALLLFIFTVFITATLYSRCLWWSSAVASTVLITLSTFMIVTKSGPMGEWRKAKTEDITSRNE
uniref:Si:ch211-235o23.1 n=1 Tax=Neogobius melanostomus TaxID=47308 RepID=A0A8C6UCS2_9GOBI